VPEASFGSTIAERLPAVRRSIRTGNNRRARLDRIEQLRSGDEHDAGAGSSQDPAARAGILRHIMLAAFDGAERDRIDDKPRLEARLDPE
jgi:hypothetical protein